MKLTYGPLVFAALATCVAASAGTVVDIDATLQGCSQCNSPSNILPGTVLSDIYTPKVQLVLGPGTYTITNADPNGTDQFGGWRYDSGNQWVWSFVVANDATGVVLMDDYVNNTDSSEAAIANQTGTTTFDGNTMLSATSTAGFTDTLVLASTTTLDFFVDDFALGDNAGGVALLISGGSVSSTPEPGSIGLTLAGLSVCAMALRKKFQVSVTSR